MRLLLRPCLFKRPLRVSEVQKRAGRKGRGIYIESDLKWGPVVSGGDGDVDAE